MKQIISPKAIFLLMFTLCTSFLFSQTIIDYQAWTSASGCNIFSDPNNASTVINVPVIINGSAGTIAHLTAIGQPAFDNTNKSVNLDSRIVNNSMNHGTEYRMTVNFKQGYTYKITVTAIRTMSSQTGGNVSLRLDLNNGGSGSNNLCTGTGVIDASGSGNLKLSQQVTSSTFSSGTGSDYTFDYNSLSAAQTYLMVAAIPPAGSVLQTILIRKIKITETPPPVSFTITPAATPITCGATTPVTYTINNGGGTTGITGYTWNLGSANNGWLYNSGNASATIITTTNTLTLTPICGSIQSNVVATVAANGNNYNTNTSVTTVSSPTITISGPNIICSQNTYSLIGTIPCGGTITWSSSDNNIATVNPTTGLATKVANGSVNILATINPSGTCNIPVISKTVTVGVPVINGVSQTSSNVCVNARTQPVSITFSLTSPIAGITYNWVRDGNVSLGTGTSKTVFGSVAGGTTLTVGQHSVSVWPAVCSVAPPYLTIPFTAIVCGALFTISPNPVSGNFTINSLEGTAIESIRILDAAGTVRISKNKIHAAKQYPVNVSSLPSGNYKVEIFDGKKWHSQQIIKN